MYEQQIARGMALLDERRPGWREEIDPGSLDLEDDSMCVLGQLYGVDDFIDGLDAVGLSMYQPIEHGFDIGNDDLPELYAVLTAEWRQALTQPAGGGDG